MLHNEKIKNHDCLFLWLNGVTRRELPLRPATKMSGFFARYAIHCTICNSPFLQFTSARTAETSSFGNTHFGAADALRGEGGTFSLIQITFRCSKKSHSLSINRWSISMVRLVSFRNVEFACENCECVAESQQHFLIHLRFYAPQDKIREGRHSPVTRCMSRDQGRRKRDQKVNDTQGFPTPWHSNWTTCRLLSWFFHLFIFHTGRSNSLL